MSLPEMSTADLRRYRNSKLYRSFTRILREYNRRVVATIHERGFPDFAPSFPQILSNVDLEGTRIGVIAARAGVTRQAAGQLITEIERCGYAARHPAPDDARAVVVRFTPRGRKLLATIFTIVEEIEAEFARTLGRAEYERVRIALGRIADEIDPQGAFGAADEPTSGSPR